MALTQNKSMVSAIDVVKDFGSGAPSWFRRNKQKLRALDGVSVHISRGETLGLVGESGCGKTTFGKAVVRLVGRIEGEVLFDGQPVYDLDARAMRLLRRRMQMVFQNPYASLNSNLSVHQIVAEGVSVSGLPKSEEENRVAYLLDQVNLNPRKASQYAWELSGGERRRVGIARILAVDPEFIVADEPVAALDLSIKSQIINLLIELQEQRGLTYLFISHDIGLVKHVSDRIAVMYLGKIVETGQARFFSTGRCLHPYTQQLLRAANYMANSRESVFDLDHAGDGRDWDVPDETPQGCRFHPRCQLYEKLGRPSACRSADPVLEVHDTIGGRPHSAACHFSGQHA